MLSKKLGDYSQSVITVLRNGVGREGNTRCVIQHAPRPASLQFGSRSNERDLMDL